MYVLRAAILGIILIALWRPASADDPFDLDPTFALGGRAAANFGSADSAQAVAIQFDGKIVAAGTSMVGGTFDFAVARFLPSGAPDVSFGSGGRVTTDFGFQELAFDVGIQTDGKILVVGGADKVGGADVVLARYNANGTLDSSFGVGGLVRTDLNGFEYAYGLAIQADGRILVVGQYYPIAFAGDTNLMVLRYLGNGQIDASFGFLGGVFTDFGGRDDIGRDIDIYDDGRIIVAGSSWGPGFSPSYGVVAVPFGRKPRSQSQRRSVGALLVRKLWQALDQPGGWSV